MSATVFPAYAAVIFGTALALLLVIPFTAIQYRRRGGLTVGIVVLHFLVLLYLVALLTYTLLPLPPRTADFCAARDAGAQLVPGRFVFDISREAGLRGGGVTAYLRNSATLQVVFNIALFIPLGMVLRYFRRTPVLVTTLIGLGASLLIETTQITGDWFLYPCAYRLFDVDDLLANTLGAFVGAFLAPVLRVFPGQERMRPTDPRKVTVLRRWLGMLCDWIVITFGALAGAFVPVAAQDELTGGVEAFLRGSASILLVALLQLVWVLASGRTIGETIVRLEPQPPARLLGRLVRWLAGTGGYALLSLGQGPVWAIILAIGVVGSVVAVIVTRNRRGLAYVIARWDVQDDREQVEVTARTARTPNVR
ncbi:VanZ family protein [Curtobacterium sp. UNCCL17]|uniref:VanZ family protein n=1 Tax=Curtobacterium sp. UNCCL17 TaxID=1449051 RepID=UPI00068C6FFA|nr:VanZ family protein [Curtobacterium sp. UNCCL17]